MLCDYANHVRVLALLVMIKGIQHKSTNLCRSAKCFVIMFYIVIHIT